MNWDTYIDKLVGIMESVEIGKVTILTGHNGGGKSMIRKLIGQFLGDGIKVASISMDMRAGINPDRCSMFDRDLEWVPTSENTLDSVESLLHQRDRFLVLDEIELGMGEELQAGLALELNAQMPEVLQRNKGVLVITHSREMVRHLNCDRFINLEAMSREEWLNREVVPMPASELRTRSNELRAAFAKRLKEK